MADTTIPTVAPEAKTATPPPICSHTWVTAAPYQARCTACGFLAPITTEEVRTEEPTPSRLAASPIPGQRTSPSAEDSIDE